MMGLATFTNTTPLTANMFNSNPNLVLCTFGSGTITSFSNYTTFPNISPCIGLESFLTNP